MTIIIRWDFNMKYLILLLVSFLFIGCFSNSKTPRTEEFFKNNILIAKEFSLECKKIGIPKDKVTRIECVNAINALMKDIKKPNRNDNNYQMGF